MSEDFRKPRRKEGDNIPDRLPAHSTEAEQGILGCCLLDPAQSIGILLEKKFDGDDFYDLRHRSIYEVLVAMWDDKKPIDLITVQQTLKDCHQLEGVGGVAYLASLQDATPSSSNLSYYADILREKSVIRRVLRACAETTRRAYEEIEDFPAFLDSMEKEILQAGESFINKADVKPIKDLVVEALTDIENLHASQGALTGIGTGFVDFDKMTRGLQGGQMVVIAARPSCGKTSLAMNIADSVAIDQNLPVGVFSLEMTDSALVKRMICSRARVNLRNVNDGFLSERDFPPLTNAAGKISKSKLFIDDTSGLSILELRARARRMWQQNSIKLLVIDYLQLMNGGGKYGNRQEEVSAISAGIKSLAKELDIPIVVLSQMSRDIEKDKDRKPRLSDLRESGAIEQDADIVAFLYKPTSEEDEQETDSIPVNLLIAKQREGATGDVHLVFLKNFTRFESAAKIQD